MAGKGIQIIVGAEYNGKDLARASREIDKLQRDAKKSGEAMQQFGNKMSGVGKSLVLGVTLPILGIGVAAISIQKDFEQSMNQLAVMTGVPGEQLKELSDLAKQMGADTVFSAGEAADAMLELAKAGFTPAEISGGALQSTMALAATEGMALADAAVIVTNTMNAFGIEAEKSGVAVDILAAGAVASTASVNDLAGGLKYVGATAGSMGVPLQDVVTGLASLSNAGIDGTTAGTSFNRMLLSLAGTTDKSASAIEQYGLQFYDAQGQVKPMLEIVGQLESAFGSLNDQERTTGLKAIFGVEGMRAANVLIDQGVEGYKSLTAAVGKQGVAAELSDARMSGTAGALEQLKGSLETAALTIGEAIAPALLVVTDVIKTLVDGFTNVSPEVKTFIVVIGAVAAAIGPLLLIAGKLIVLVGAVKVALVGAGGLAGIAAVAAPIAIVVAAVAGLIAIFVGLYRESEVFRNAVKSAFEAVRDAVSGAVDTIREKLESNGDAINILKDVFKALGDFIGAYIIPIYKTYLVAAIEAVTTAIGLFIDYLGFLVQAFQVALTFGLDFAANIVQAFGNMYDGVLGYLELLIDGLLTTLGFIPGIGDALRAASDAVKGFRADVKTNVDGIVGGFRSASDAVSQFGTSSGEAYGAYTYSARGAMTATDDYRDAAVRASMAVDTTRTGLGLLADVTSAATTATLTLNDAYADLSAFFSETAAIDRAHTQLQELQTQMASNTAGFDGMSDAAKANRSTFMDWANSQIAAAKTLEDPVARLDALKTVQQEARDALRAQGIDPKTSGFYQEVKGNVDAAKEAVGELGDATATAEAGGMTVAAAIAAGIAQGMGASESALNAAGLAGGEATIDGLEAGAGVASPSTFANSAGRNVAAGLTNGLSEMDFSIRLGGNIAGRALITGMVAGLNSGSSGLYARVRSIVAAAVAAANSAAGAGGSNDEATNVARGGYIRGRGGPMADLIPAMLSNGEFVIRAQAVEAFGPGFFDALNRGRNPLDGMEAPGPSRPSSNAGGSLVINGGITVQSASGERADQSLPRALRRMAFLAGA